MESGRCSIHGTVIVDGWCEVMVGGERHPVWPSVVVTLTVDQLEWLKWYLKYPAAKDAVEANAIREILAAAAAATAATTERSV